MNKAQRQERSFDEAAEQAMKEGVSSFGIGFERFSAKQLEIYKQAAESRGVVFMVTSGTAGIFVDPELEDVYSEEKEGE